MSIWVKSIFNEKPLHNQTTISTHCACMPASHLLRGILFFNIAAFREPHWLKVRGKTQTPLLKLPKEKNLSLPRGTFPARRLALCWWWNWTSAVCWQSPHSAGSSATNLAGRQSVQNNVKIVIQLTLCSKTSQTIFLCVCMCVCVCARLLYILFSLFSSCWLPLYDLNSWQGIKSNHLSNHTLVSPFLGMVEAPSRDKIRSRKNSPSNPVPLLVLCAITLRKQSFSSAQPFNSWGKFYEHGCIWVPHSRCPFLKGQMV